MVDGEEKWRLVGELTTAQRLLDVELCSLPMELRVKENSKVQNLGY